MSERNLVVVAILLALAGAPAAEEAETEETAIEEAAADRIIFTVTGFKNDKGHLRCGLFPEDGWLDTSVRSVDAEIAGARAVCEFLGVPAGTYGISSYHDKNDNGKMDLGFMRIPKEGYAASNDARGSFGPPKFADAKFTYGGGQLELASEIR